MALVEYVPKDGSAQNSSNKVSQIQIIPNSSTAMYRVRAGTKNSAYFLGVRHGGKKSQSNALDLQRLAGGKHIQRGSSILVPI